MILFDDEAQGRPEIAAFLRRLEAPLKEQLRDLVEAHPKTLTIADLAVLEREALNVTTLAFIGARTHLRHIRP